MTDFRKDWTPEQTLAVADIYDRDPAVAEDLIAFARTVHNYGPYLGVEWKGMFLGIEKDGHTHS